MTGDWGTAHVEICDGWPVVVAADDVVGITFELLAQSADDAFPVQADGCILLAGDPAFRYRPTRVGCLEPGGTARVLVCERVR